MNHLKNLIPALSLSVLASLSCQAEGEGDRPLSLWERVRVRVGNSLEWNNHSASLRLALHTIFHGLQAIESRSPLVGHPKWGKQAFRRQTKARKNRTLQPVQLRFLG